MLMMLVIGVLVVMTNCSGERSIASSGCRGAAIVLLPPLLMRVHDGKYCSSGQEGAISTRVVETDGLNHNG